MASPRHVAGLLLLPWLVWARAPGDEEPPWETADDAQMVLGAVQQVINDPLDDVSCTTQRCDPEDHLYCAPPMRVCRQFDPCVGVHGATGRVCLHKNLWPWWPDDVALLITIFIIGICGGITGIGGGGLNVPMLMLWSLFDIKEAVPLSHAAIVGNSLVMLCFNAPQRHPAAPTRPLIHYELALLLLPAMLAGSNLGVLVGRVFPPTLLILLSLVLLAFTSLKTLVKGRKLAKANHLAREATPGEALLNGTAGRGCESPQHAFFAAFGDAPMPVKIWPSLPSTLQSTATGSNCNSTVSCSSPHNDVDINDGRHFAFQRSWSGTVMQVGAACAMTPVRRPAGLVSPTAAPEKLRVPWLCICVMVVSVIAVSVDSILMKEEPMCSVAYWVTFAMLYPIAVATVAFGAGFMGQLAKYHEERGERVEGEVVVTPRTLVTYPAAMTLVGLVSGLLGLGGGEFMVPLMLEMGLPPRVAGATSGFIMLLTTLTDIAHYGITGVLQAFMQYCIAMFCVASCGGLVGLILRDTRYCKANSHLIVYLLAGLLASSGALLGFRGLYHATLDWELKPFCPR